VIKIIKYDQKRAEMIHQKDLVPERHERLRDFIRQRSAVRVDEICSELGVSPATARRDLEELEKTGRIRRVHGGAVSVESRLDEPLFDDKTSLSLAEKHRIAETALQYIKTGDTLYLDGGSTVLELARLLVDRADVTVVTNSLRAALELSGRGPRVLLIGGELRRRSQTMVGTLTRNTLQDLHFDTAFMGTIGLTLQDGLTTTDPNEAFTKDLVMQHADQVVLLADHSKIGKVSFARVGSLSDIDVIITDHSTDPAFLIQAKKQNLNVIQPLT
jgi:DeoR/GlpR family transcriptional regulator of sugar metabolism